MSRQLVLFGLTGLALCLATGVYAEAPLRVAQADTVTYPLVQLDTAGKITGGLLAELGDRLALKLGTHAVQLTFSRRRLEDAVMSGSADISCYLSPHWSDRYSKSGRWTIATLPQIERLVAANGRPLPKRIPDDFAGKRVAVILGYHYPRIQPLFDQGRATRQDFTRVEQLFHSVELGSSDVLISSEDEILGYLAANPGKRMLFTVGTDNFTLVKTQCLVSPHSPWSLARIDAALASLAASGELERLAKRYGMTMQ
jgi:ABC-type amino acid transport substrate-binding protein